MVSNCIVHHCCSLFSFLSPSSFIYSPLVISLIIIIIGGSSSGFVLYLSYRTVLISTVGSYIDSPPHLSGSEGWEVRREGASEQLCGSELPAGCKPQHTETGFYKRLGEISG